MSIRKTCAVAMGVLLSHAMIAQAVSVDLYSAEDNQLSASGSTTRAQRFSPTQSTPNSLLGTDLFDMAAMGIFLQSTDTLGGTLSLYTWNTDYATTKAGAALGSTPVNLAGPGGGGSVVHWLNVTPGGNLAASGQYMIELAVTSYGNSGTSGWGLVRSNSDDGGPNNVAFNNGSAASAREYQVRLGVVPEPATLALLVFGGVAMLRRRR